MKIRIFNDGKPGYMTQLTDVETGKVIEHCTDADVHLKINVQDMPKALITTIMPVIDVIVDAEIQQVCPVCGKPSETPPTKKTQQENVVAMVKAWEDEQVAEREGEEQQRQVKLIIQSALEHAADFGMRRTPADTHSVNEFIGVLTDNLIHCITNLA